MNHELNIQIRKSILDLTILKGRDAFLSGVFEKLVAEQGEALRKAIAAAA